MDDAEEDAKARKQRRRSIRNLRRKSGIVPFSLNEEPSGVEHPDLNGRYQCHLLVFCIICLQSLGVLFGSELGHITLWNLIMKYFLYTFSTSFRSKKGSFQLLEKVQVHVCGPSYMYLLTA